MTSRFFLFAFLFFGFSLCGMEPESNTSLKKLTEERQSGGDAIESKTLEEKAGDGDGRDDTTPVEPPAEKPEDCDDQTNEEASGLFATCCWFFIDKGLSCIVACQNCDCCY